MLKSKRSFRLTLYLIGLIGLFLSIFAAFIVFKTIANRIDLVMENILTSRVDLYKERLYSEDGFVTVLSNLVDANKGDVPSQLLQLEKSRNNPYLLGQYWIPVKKRPIDLSDIKLVHLKDFLQESPDLKRQVIEQLENSASNQYQNLAITSYLFHQKKGQIPVIIIVGKVYNQSKTQRILSGYHVNILDLNKIFSSQDFLRVQPISLSKLMGIIGSKNDSSKYAPFEIKVEQLRVQQNPSLIYKSENFNDEIFSRTFSAIHTSHNLNLNNLNIEISIVRLLPVNRLNIAMFVFFSGLLFTLLFVFLAYRGILLQSESQARRFAQKQMKDKNDFFDILAHELRTPLNGILGMANLLIKSPLNSEQQHYADTLMLSSYSLRLLVDQSLTLSRLNLYEMELVEEQFSLNKMMNDIIDSLGPLAILKKIDLKYHLSKELNGISLLSDELRIKQVLINLVGNAIKFTEEGSVNIVVTSKAIQTQNMMKSITFEVKDTGIGIAPEMQDKLFRKFSRIKNNSFVNPSEGGLGLQISQKIIRKMGGIVYFESEQSGGANFYFTLEIKTVPTDEVLLSTFDYSSKRFLFLTQANDQALLEFAQSLKLKGAKVRILHHIDEIRMYFFRLQPERSLPDVIYLNDELDSDSGLVDGVSIHSLIQQDLRPRLIYLHQQINSYQRIRIIASGIRESYLKPFNDENLLQTSIELINKYQTESIKVNATDNSLSQKNIFSQNYHILVAEDNLVNLEIICHMLTALGHTFREAKNGTEVLDRLSQETFDLILMDINMPEMDGFEVTRRIRDSAKAYQDITIIAISANLDDYLKQTAEISGMNGYLSKPIELNTLGDKITDALLYPPKF
jgi:signal transduction histidine kinase/CheY-like chemotaxis protein